MSITIKTSDDKLFTMEKVVAMQSKLLRDMIADLGEENPESIPLSNVTGDVFAKVIEYNERHKEDPYPVEEEEDRRPGDMTKIDDWDKNYIEEIGKNKHLLFDISIAANYLDIPSLLDLSSYTIAQQINGKTTEEIADYFEVENTFTPEEQAKIREEYKWLLE